MDNQDNKFNYKIILAALVAVIIGILIAFYYSYAQSKAQINYLEEEKSLLVKDLTLMKTEVDRLAALNEVNEIELQDSRFRIQELLDSVGRLNFTVTKLTEYRKELRILEASYDSLKLSNNFLKYNNMLLSDKYEETRRQIEELRGKSSSLAEAEAELRRKNQELNRELRRKDYLILENAEGNGFRIRGGRSIKTNKASTIKILRGCVTILGDNNPAIREKVLYFQFLGPNMSVIEDNANTISVSGNIYSKRVEILDYKGEEVAVCDYITIPEGSLEPGTYTLNVFEDQRLLTSTDFQLR